MSWNQIGEDIDGEAADDRSGYSVSLNYDGTIVAIGAPFNDGHGTYSGQVRVYKNVNGNWNKIGQDIDGEAAGDGSGWSVSLSDDGTIVAIGAPNNDGNGTNSGQVRVYKNISNTWTQIGLDINGEADGDQSGWSVSLSADGTIVAIGAPKNDGHGTNSGQVRVYQYKSVAGSYTWSKIGQDIDGEAAGDYCGSCVSLSADGTIVAIGAPDNDDSKGQVRVYQYDILSVPAAWKKIGQNINGEAQYDESGWSVSLSADGTIVAIGAPNNDGHGTNSGQVRVYKNINDNWTKIGQDIDGEANDYSGRSVSLNNDGTIVAIGAPNNAGNGTNSGQVRVYQNISNTWTQIGQDIDGEAANDQSGWSVSINANGTIVAIGAPYNDVNGTIVPIGAPYNGTDSGEVKVYKYKLTPTITDFNISTKTYGDIPFTITPPTSNSDGAFTYTSSNTEVATIYGEIITIVGPGTSTILATQAATPNYTSGTIETPFQVLQNSGTNPVNISNGAELTYFLTTSAQFANISTDVTIFDNLTASNDFKYIFNYSQDFINITRQ